MTDIKPRKFGRKELDTNITNPMLNSKNVPSTLKPAFEWLSQKVFQVEGKAHYVYYCPVEKRNVEVANSGELESRVLTHYTGENANGVILTQEIIKTYLKALTMLVKGQMAMPLAGAIAKWDSKTYINSFVDNALVPTTTDYTKDEETLLNEYLEILAEGLFSIYEYKMDIIKFKEIVLDYNYSSDNVIAEKEKILNFFFNWVAAIYLRPGIKLPTVPCFFGRIHGVGKGTLSNILVMMLGNSIANVTLSNGIERFNSDTDGKLLVMYNEVDQVDGFYNYILKGENSEETRFVEAKGKDKIQVINILNTILCSNQLAPFAIDEGDRRLVVIQTLCVDVAKFKQKLDIYRQKMGDDLTSFVATQLVKVIAQVDIEQAIPKSSLYNALYTEAKSFMENSNISPLDRFFTDPEVRFFDIDASKTKTQQKRTSISKLEKLFSSWISTENQMGLANVLTKYSKTAGQFKKDINIFAQENKYVTKSEKSELFFTEEFYEWYVSENTTTEDTDTNEPDSKVVNIQDKRKKDLTDIIAKVTEKRKQ